MKHHLLAFASAALDASAGLVTLPAPSDGLLRFSSNVLQTTDEWQLLTSFAGGVGLVQARMNSASSRIRGYPNLTPLNASVLAGSRPGLNDMRDTPITLKAYENITVQVTNADAQNTVVLMTLARDGLNYNINRSGIRKVKFTAAVTSLAFGWSNEGNVVLADDLEAGRYEVYGMEVWEADCVAARLVFKDQVERPGCPAQQLVSDIPSDIYCMGLGGWGSFDSITPPFIQGLHVAAAAQTLTGYLYIAKV